MIRFPPKMGTDHHRKRTTATPPPPPTASPYTTELRSKLGDVISKQEQVKVAFHGLKSQVSYGLREAEEVFASLAVPLMKLIGAKDAELAEEGRSSAFVFDSLSTPKGNNMTRASKVIKQLAAKQRAQVVYLIELLKRIENQVNFCQGQISQSLDDHRASVQKLFEQAVYHITAIQGQQPGLFVFTLKLLRAVFKNVSVVLGSVENHVEILMQELAGSMGDPIMEYISGLKDDMQKGTCVELLDIIEEMEGMVRDGRLELEAERRKLKAAEEWKTEAFCKVKEAEEKVRRMCEHFRICSYPEMVYTRTPYLNMVLAMEDHQLNGVKQSLVPQSNMRPTQLLNFSAVTPNHCDLLGNLCKRKFSGVEGLQEKNGENQVCDPSKKQRLGIPQSPMGPNQLLNFSTKKTAKHRDSSGPRSPMIDHRQVTRSCMILTGHQTPGLNARVLLGSSPSVLIQPSNFT